MKRFDGRARGRRDGSRLTFLRVHRGLGRRRRPAIAAGRGRQWRRLWRRTVRGRRPRRHRSGRLGGRLRGGGRAATLFHHAAGLVVLLVLSFVFLQLGGRLEKGDTVLARVGRLAGVGLEVSAQVGHLHEKPIAVRTPERLFAGVQSDVRLEMMVPGETLVTHRTHERLFAGVRAFVVLEHVFVAELFAARVALERPRLARARRRRRVGRRSGRRHR